MRNKSYGELFHQPNSFTCSGKWMNNLIERISKLKCECTFVSDNLHNGINVSLCKKSNTNILGKEIAKFLVLSYIVKNKSKTLKNNGENGDLTYQRIVNLVLDTIDYEYVSIVNKEVIESIITILNHPHFKDCHNIEDIHKKILTIKTLNHFNTKDEDKEYEKITKNENLQKNIFLD